jgi:MoaA/NifB/PqqE/SkfB family radical SAM enzyme
MIKKLFHCLIPASLYRSRTAFPVLSRVDQELQHCLSTSAAIEILSRAKPDLCVRLRTRFPSPLAEALTLKVLNLCLARYHFRVRSASLLSRPFGLVVDPSNVCQLACPGCVHSTSNSSGNSPSNRAFQLFDWPNGTLSENRMSALLKRYGPYAIGTVFYSYGEPLLNLNTPNLIRRAKAWLMGTTISTTLSVRRFDAEAYVESGLDFMGLSIDGATQLVYQRFRRNGDLQLVFDNLRKLVDAKRKLGRRYPVLAWNFLAFEHNAHEIPLAARMARRLGVNIFRVVQPFDVSWDDPEIRPAKLKAGVYGVRRLDSLSMTNQSTNWNPFPDSVDVDAVLEAYENPWNEQATDDSPPSPGHTCHWLYKNIVMDATGRIMPCCGAPRPDINLVFGAFDGNGGDPFHSEKYRQARAWFSSDVPASADAPHCTRCEWDHTAVNIGGADIRNYFQSASGAFFDRQSLSMLSGW